MHFSSFVGVAATIVSAQALTTGFNYGSTLSDGTTPKTQQMFEQEFQAAKSLAGTKGTDNEFTSARLYTMIQGGTTDSPIEAIQAAITTKTTLLLGLWASVPQSTFDNEITALTAAIKQYGTAFTDLVDGISVGSEDLYRESPTGIENGSGYGQTPEMLVQYIQQTQKAIAGTSLSGAKIGHVDTWTAWVNGSNSAVTAAVDWLGVDTYPYFENTVPNAIGDSQKVFWDSVKATQGAANGKDVWITETGFPVSGKTSGQAVPSVQNAETYWQDIACALVGNYNIWWYTLQDAEPTTPNPSFGILGANLNSAPLYDLKCKKELKPPSSSSGSGSGSGSSSGSSAGSTADSTSSSDGSKSNNAPKAGAGAAAGAAIVAVFALMATL